VDAVVFTGSTEVGRVVAARCAERLCPVTLELGGKDPMLVLDDADLGRAVEGALWGSFTNCGQVCSGVERIYVARELYEPFATGLVERAASLRLGRGDDLSTEIGPLISAEQRDRVEALVADAVERGAVVATGGARAEIGLPGWFFEPTVLLETPVEARTELEEIFGPVVTVSKVENESDGVLRANASRYALGASVWTRSRERARRVSAQLTAGSVWMNDCAYSYGAHQAPWGGRKDSGHGRTHSKHGLHALSQVKFADEDRGRLAPPWWYPYDARSADGFRGAFRLLYGHGARARARAAWRHRGDLRSLAGRALRR
jgi:succinate-semialdehyde dehydrogenase/glutarate-semialdehyde dehydrogenase